ncbi:hypothetical protein [Limibacillus sp. MBR-115]|uniref:hypothetical protein n=1 Tax=Limibacillus sp. MBR-115 TaxID=3156465 RepID=UPI0033910EC9
MSHQKAKGPPVSGGPYVLHRAAAIRGRHKNGQATAFPVVVLLFVVVVFGMTAPRQGA